MSKTTTLSVRIIEFPHLELLKGKKLKQSHYRPEAGLLGFQEVEASRFLDSRHMKVVRLSVLRTGRLYPAGKIPGTHFC
jgi:hypothetical protein